MQFHIKLVNAFINSFFVRVGGALKCFNFFFKEGEKNFEILLGLGQTHSLASLGLSLGLWGLTMCATAVMAHTNLIIPFFVVFNIDSSFPPSLA